MGHIQKMTDKQRLDWFAYQYKAKLEAQRGSNYKYFNQEEWDKLEAKGYEMYRFPATRFFSEEDATTSELEAKEVVDKLKSEGNYARIICGYIQTRQRVKHFTVIFK